MTVTTRIRRTAFVGVLALSALAACDRRTEEQSGGDVEYNWTPAKVDAVAGVPAAEITASIQQRLAGEAPEGVSADLWKHVGVLYKAYTGAPLWMESDGPNETRTRALIQALVDAHTDALRLDEYPIAALYRAISDVRESKPASAEQIAEADVLLSSAYLALAEDLLDGQVDPKSVSTDWHIDYQHEKLDSAVVLSLRADQLDRGIARMRPQGMGYEGLRTALTQVREVVARGGWPTVPEGRPLARGDRDSAARLAALRARLAAEGFLPADSAAAATPATPAAATPATTTPTTTPATQGTARPAASAGTGQAVYDRTLSDAVGRFQERHAITVDGRLGEETVKALNVSAEYRLGQIAANMERHRWFPRNLGQRYIFVNVPAFHLQAFDSGRVALEMKVIVGEEYEGRTTPVFSDMMEMVVFRPYWNVTPDIQRKELEPKVAADPGYMAANNYEWWTDGGARRIRQRPGPKNSLGLVKFLFPNSYNIYLHDTPSRNLFQKDVRAFSHGCIRLERPAELAQWVLGWDAGRVEEAMQGGKDNRTIMLPKKLPVYIAYFTTYTREGQLHYGNDLYSRDDALVEAMMSGARPSGAALQALEQLKQLIS